MLILALESSAKSASAAVCSGSELIGQYIQNSGLTHSRTLLVMAESLLKNLALSVADIELFAVSNGPGSFTGVRIGVSAVKGLAWGLDKPVCGVSTLEAMAWQYPTNPDTILCPVMDARRDQVYNALFRWDRDKPVRLIDDRAVSLSDLSAECARSVSPWILIGDGAVLASEYLCSNLPSKRPALLQLAPVLLRFQTAFGVALAAQHNPLISASVLEPFYLRPSQAERERLNLT